MLLKNAAVFLLLFIGVGVLVNYIINKGEESPPPLSGKLWLIPTLVFLICSPILIIGFAYFLLIKGMALFSDSLSIGSNGTLFAASILIVVLLAIVQFIIHPVIKGLLKFFLHEEILIPLFLILSLFIDTVAIYIALKTLGIDINQLRATSFSIAVFLFLFNSIAYGSIYLFKRFNRQSID